MAWFYSVRIVCGSSILVNKTHEYTYMSSPLSRLILLPSAMSIKAKRLDEDDKAMEAANANDKKAGKAGDDAKMKASFTKKILENIQFTIRRVHIRYEDDSSCPARPFTAGVTLRELSMVSCDAAGATGFTYAPSSPVIFKVVELKDLSVYLGVGEGGGEGDEGAEVEFFGRDGAGLGRMSEVFAAQAGNEDLPSVHQYIIRPISATARISVSKNDFPEPKVGVKLSVESIRLELRQAQYRTVLSLLESANTFSKYRKYKQFRPPRRIFDRVSGEGEGGEHTTRLWWQYVEEKREGDGEKETRDREMSLPPCPPVVCVEMCLLCVSVCLCVCICLPCKTKTPFLTYYVRGLSLSHSLSLSLFVSPHLPPRYAKNALLYESRQQRAMGGRRSVIEAFTADYVALYKRSLATTAGIYTV